MRVLEPHHGRAMPQGAKHVLASYRSFSSGARPSFTSSQAGGSRGSNSASKDDEGWTTVSRRRKAWRSWTVCPARCGGWAYDDRGFSHCKKRGAAYTEEPRAGAAPVAIDEALVAKLAPDDPLKEMLDRIVASGAGTMVPQKKANNNPFAEAQGRLKTATYEMVKAQNQLNHQRTLVLQAREKLAKLMDGMLQAEVTCREKLDALREAGRRDPPRGPRRVRDPGAGPLAA